MTAVVTLTLNPTIDISMEVDEVVPEHKLRADLMEIDPGGGGINVARVLHRLGVAATAVAPTGGMSGEILKTELAEESVTLRPVPVEAPTRRAATLFARRTGEHYRIVTEGLALTEAEWRTCLDEVAGSGDSPEFVVLSGSFPPGVPPTFVAELATVAADLGARLVVDTSGPALQAAVAAGTALVKPNLRELRQLVGAAEGELDYEVAARDLVERGVDTVVVSLGSDGAFFASAGGVEGHAASIAVEVVSTVGAGDSTLAGIIAGLVEGRDLRGAVQLGMAAGAAACITEGSQLCRVADVRRLDAAARGRAGLTSSGRPADGGRGRPAGSGWCLRRSG